jgi:hypothetical protein
MVNIPSIKIPKLARIIFDLLKNKRVIKGNFNLFAEFLDSFFESPIQFPGYEFPKFAILDKDSEDRIIVYSYKDPYMTKSEYDKYLEQKDKKEKNDSIKTKIDIQLLNIPNILSDNIIDKLVALRNDKVIMSKVLDVAI